MEIDYKIAGLSLQKAAIADQLRRVHPTDHFAGMLLMGKLKAVEREINALTSPSSQVRGQ